MYIYIFLKQMKKGNRLTVPLRIYLDESMLRLFKWRTIF